MKVSTLGWETTLDSQTSATDFSLRANEQVSKGAEAPSEHSVKWPARPASKWEVLRARTQAVGKDWGGGRAGSQLSPWFPWDCLGSSP